MRHVFNTLEFPVGCQDHKQRLINDFRTKPFDELKSRVYERVSITALVSQSYAFLFS